MNEELAAASAPFPKFARHCGTLNANFGNKGALATYDSSAALNLKFLNELAATAAGTSNSPH
jgi:hypothetical protein